MRLYKNSAGAVEVELLSLQSYLSFGDRADANFNSKMNLPFFCFHKYIKIKIKFFLVV